MAAIALVDVSRRFPGGTEAVRNLSLAVEDGELMVIVGPSGSGKSTVLRMVAGLEEVTSGEIRIGGRVVNQLPPRDRDIAMVFQNYALYPHMSVFENMAFALRVRKTSRAEIRRKVEAAASLLGIGSLLGRTPRQLSGGQRQRVAMGRAIVREPVAFLMDEPLSNLDAKLRVQMRTELAQLQRRLNTTTLYVTHDQTEAMTMGDRVAVMHQGALQQVDRPQVLYDRPKNLFVAGFLGSPAINLIRARLSPAGECRVVARFGSHALTVPQQTFERCPDLASFIGRDVVLGIRPEDIRDSTTDPGADRAQHIRVTIAVVESVGAELIAHFPVGEEPGAGGGTPDVVAESDHEGAVSFTARLHPRVPARRNEELALAVDVERLHFFDPATGEALGWPMEQAFSRPDHAI